MYNIFVGHKSFDITNVTNIHENLMKKHDI